MKTVLVGNILAFIASIFMVSSGFIKSKKRIIICQTFDSLFFTLSDLILNGFTGLLVNVIMLIRNLLVYLNKYTLLSKIIIIAFTFWIGIILNNNGIPGYLPLIAAFIYVFLGDTENVILYKIYMIIMMIMWIIYDIFIKSYVGAFFDFLTIMANIYAIFVINKEFSLKSKKNNLKKIIDF